MSLEINKVHLMSCIDGMNQMNESSVDLVVTSPPYDNLRTYNDSSEWTHEVFKQVADAIIRVLKPGGVCAWNVADAIVELHKTPKGSPKATSQTGSSFRQCLYFMDQGLNLHDNLLYAKPAARFAAGAKSLRHSNVYEYCFVLSKHRPNTINLIVDKPNKGAGKLYVKGGGRKTTGERIGRSKDKDKYLTPEFGVRTNIWTYTNSHPNREVYEHPALMPPGLALDLIKTYSKEGDLVLDPFMGSGTTARQAFDVDRNFIGFEIDPTFHALCEKVTGEYTNRGRLDFG